MHLLDLQRVITVVEIKWVHADVTFKVGRLAQIGLDIVDAEIAYRPGEFTLKLHAVGHLVHDLREHADVGQHDIGRAYRGVEHHRVDEAAEVVEAVIVHIKVKVETTVVGFHLEAIEVDALLRHHGIGLQVPEVQTANFGSAQIGDVGTDRVAQDKQIARFEIDVFKYKMGIVHQVLVGLLGMVGILVPKGEVDIFERNFVDDDGHGVLLGLLLVALERLGEEGKIKLVFPLIFDEIGLGILQFHIFKMELTVKQVWHIDSCTQLLYLCQAIAFQIFNRYIFDQDSKIGGDHQTAHLDVGTSFFRKITAGKTHCKLLNDRVLYGNKEAHDDGQYHHKKDENAMDNLFFNNFDPPK